MYYGSCKIGTPVHVCSFQFLTIPLACSRLSNSGGTWTRSQVKKIGWGPHSAGTTAPHLPSEHLVFAKNLTRVISLVFNARLPVSYLPCRSMLSLILLHFHLILHYSSVQHEWWTHNQICRNKQTWLSNSLERYGIPCIVTFYPVAKTQGLFWI